MKTIFLLFLAWLSAGCMLPSERQQQQKTKIQELKTENKRLEDEKTSLHGQNKKLKVLADRILQRLGQYAKIEKRLIEENHDLYSKLYKERVSDQLTRKNQREKDLSELELEAQKLLQANGHGVQQFVDKLAKMRDELLDAKLWQRKDEIRFVDVTEQLMRNSLSAQENSEARSEAVALQEDLQRRIDQLHNNSGG